MSNVTNDLLPQPDPTPATGDVWLEIIALIPDDDVLKPYCVERRQQGIDRYGTPLQRGNGRDHLLDALQEALDLMVYLKALDISALDAEACKYVRIAQISTCDTARKLAYIAQPMRLQACGRCGSEFSARVNHAHCTPCVDDMYDDYCQG